MKTRLGDITAALDSLYDPAWSAEWDAVGLVCGDPEAPVERVLFAIDPVASVADEAIACGSQLLVTHHPLYLRGTSSVAATTAKGRLVHRLISAGVGLFVAHTNADVASPGVSDALAAAVGLADVRPLQPEPAASLDKVVTFVPTGEDVDRVLDALSEAGAGAIGDYQRCAFMGEGNGTFLPGAGASPTIGEPGRIERVVETRLEMVLPRADRAAVVQALLAAHPYEEPAYDVIELAAVPGPRGLGRVGELQQTMPLRDFVDVVARGLPATRWGVRALGNPDRTIGTVAVCGGAGGELATAARRAGAQVLLTADLRHHPASETAEDEVVALVDAAHWATEWPWLADAARQLTDRLADDGITVETRVSTRVTDPWTLHACSPGPLDDDVDDSKEPAH